LEVGVIHFGALASVGGRTRTHTWILVSMASADGVANSLQRGREE
jgi:hypothetical protein